MGLQEGLRSHSVVWTAQTDSGGFRHRPLQVIFVVRGIYLDPGGSRTDAKALWRANANTPTCFPVDDD